MLNTMDVPSTGGALGGDDLRALVAAETFDLLAARVARDGMPVERAERVVEQTLGFLVACGRSPGLVLGPSAEVDKGWHAFVLHTAEYAAFCDQIAGRFLHHTPDDDTPDVESGGAAVAGKARVAATVAAMRAAGLHVDAELWAGAADCSQCHAGCADSPRGR